VLSATTVAVQKTVKPTSGLITWANRWDHILARLGVRRGNHRVEPGLYSIGHPDHDSPVLVSANYTLSFDALRFSLVGADAYILVLDTKGINVWCAAGKGTFGTDELVQRVKGTGLLNVVDHRTLILPQLGAPGVSAHEVRERSGFRVKYGPVRAQDLQEYLLQGRITPEMRRVRFGVADRAVLIPVEAAHILVPLLVVVTVLKLTGVVNQIFNPAVAAVVAGIVLFPLLLPWIPTRDFSTKGFILGAVAALPLIFRDVLSIPQITWWRVSAQVLSTLLLVSSITAYLSLNFTGSTTFTSRSGVRREIFRYVPVMAVTFMIGLVLAVLLRIF